MFFQRCGRRMSWCRNLELDISESVECFFFWDFLGLFGTFCLFGVFFMGFFQGFF